jgi:hypothetical protein
MADQLAELERQVGPCPVISTLVIACLTDWVKQSGGLKPDLPHLPQSLTAAYAAWTHQALDC